MTKTPRSTLDPAAFGGFTRDRLVNILKQSLGSELPGTEVIAATFLAALEPHGLIPGNEAIPAAMDVLARAGTPVSEGLLWQAAEHAQNGRIRVEAIRRSGPFARPERRSLLRKWATEGFSPSANFQNDQIGAECVREAAATALGDIKNPTSEDIATVTAILSEVLDQKKFTWRVFNAACEAYWKIGDIASLTSVASILSRSCPNDTGICLTSLAAKFSAEQLKPHADALRKAFLEHARQWQVARVQISRLIALAERITSPRFLAEWAANYGADGLENGRGTITKTLLSALGERNADAVNGFLVLARWPGNLVPESPVVRGLTECARGGHGKMIAKTIIDQSCDGYQRLLETGEILNLYESFAVAATDICESLSESRAGVRQRPADTVAKGFLVVASRIACSAKSKSLDIWALTGGSGGREPKLDRDVLQQRVNEIERLDPSHNPFTVVARLLCPPASMEGALSFAQAWLGMDEAIATGIMRAVIHQAGRPGVHVQSDPMLRRFEQSVLAPGQQRSLRTMFGTILASSVLVDGRLNRYALDVMQREKLSFQSASRTAMENVSCQDDGQFLLERLRQEGMSVFDVVDKGVSFHKDGDSDLTAFVQSASIALAANLLVGSEDMKQRDGFAQRLHKRFHDLPAVRAAAYQACGELGSFLSIRPLRERQVKETDITAKTVMGNALASLRDRLVQHKPLQDKQDEIRRWLEFVADLGDSALMPHVKGYLIPPHSDHKVREFALEAIARMGDPRGLDIVKQFINDTTPEGEILAAARHARMVLEKRNDMGLFDVLAKFYGSDADVLDPAINYQQVLGASLVHSTTRALQKAQKFWEEAHWDEFLTKISGVIEALIRHVVRTRYSRMNWDQVKAENLARGNFANILHSTEFQNTFGKLQAHANTLYGFRHDSPTAHVMNTDGSPKAEATQEDAEYVREEFLHAFVEAIDALR